MGLDGFLVSFEATLSESANKAAIAFHAELQVRNLPHIVETSVSLASVFLRYDPAHLTPKALQNMLEPLAQDRDWYQASLPAGRRIWTIPAVFDPRVALQIEEAASLAGRSIADSVKDLTHTTLRVLALGFAPGQPYLGTLPEQWDIPRQTALTKKIPAGAIAVAVRQLVLFTNDAPTGWRHVGQTAFRTFAPEQDEPFALKPGDEVTFRAVDSEELEDLKASDPHGRGGAICEDLT